MRPYWSNVKKRGHRTIRLGWVKLRTDRPVHEYHFVELRFFL